MARSEKTESKMRIVSQPPWNIQLWIKKPANPGYIKPNLKAGVGKAHCEFLVVYCKAEMMLSCESSEALGLFWLCFLIFYKFTFCVYGIGVVRFQAHGHRDGYAHCCL